MESIAKSVLSAIIAYSAHYATTKIYNDVCVPDGIWGYIQGLVSIGSPICQVGVRIIENTQVSYSSMIVMGITRIIVDLVAPNSKV